MSAQPVPPMTRTETQQALRDGAAMNETVTPVLPSASNDQWLADSINELRRSDAEYARLKTEEARAEWETLARANLAREHSQKQQREQNIAIAQSQDAARFQKDVTGLLQHAQELSLTIPQNATEWNAPLDTLRDYAKTSQELDRAAQRIRENPALEFQTDQQPPQPQRLAKPETFPDGSLYQLTNLPDGNLQVKLITGEVYKGDPITVTQKLAESQVNTKRWGQQARSLATQAQQPSQQTSASVQSAVTYDANGQPQVDYNKIPDLAKWQLDNLAQIFGFKDGSELVSDQVQLRQRTEGLQQEVTALREEREAEIIGTTFIAQCPDFPSTDEAIQALTSLMDQNKLEYSATNLEMAHNYAVRNGMYQPVPQERLHSEVRRVTPPPPPPASSADNRPGQNLSAWEMPLDQLRKKALGALQE